AAKAEGTVVIYGPPGTGYRQMLVTDFEQTHPGIKVDAIFVPPTERMSRVSLERQAGRYLADLWISGTTPSVTDAKDAHFTQPLKPQLMLPEVVDESLWFQHKLWWADAEEPDTVLMFVGSVLPIMYVNSKMVDPRQFSSYWDLLDPKWKGKIASTDVRNPGPGAAPARFMFKQPQLGPNFFTRLFGEMDVKLSQDQRQLVDWVSQGTYPIGLFMSQNEVDLAAKQGLPIATVPAEQFKEGATIGPANGAVAMLDRAPHPNAAKLYLNWLLSREGQIAWQRDIGDNSFRTDIPKDGVNPLVIPKVGVDYVNSGTEDFSRSFSPSTLSKPIDEGLKKASGP
ncbi:MAG TPA: extracellular solute-binding protein, partial [Chloroflexota bacterium]|nr:extracellular solute-binding protein [Chloroflexota bacterium]